MFLATSAVSLALAAAAVSVPLDLVSGPSPEPSRASPQATLAPDGTVQISILTYNVRGLPWPLALGRGQALKAIGRQLAALREAGQQPDVVLIQEGFRDEIRELVEMSGYRFWAQGPSRSDKPPGAGPGHHGRYPKVRYPLAGEGWGKFTGSGLHVLSDLPILEVRSEAFRACAGFDCLANKGVMLARLALPDGAGEVDIVNSHLNAKGASKTPQSRNLRAHHLQTEQLIAFIRREHPADIPLLVGGDFNVRGAPARYDYHAETRPYVVVSEFCQGPQARCDGQIPDAEPKPWLRSQDLQAFSVGGPVEVRPLKVATVFDAARGERALSDHAGYLVRYQLHLAPAGRAQAAAPPTVRVKPTFGPWGFEVSWRP